MGLEDDEPIYAEPADTDDAWARDAGPGDGAWPGRRGDRGAPGFSVRLAAAVAVVAAAAGVTAGLLLVLPALSGQGNGQPQLMLTDRVLAISHTSITIGGNGPSVTAAITRSTKITGAVHGIGGVKAGAEVSAQIIGTSGHLTATAIQDPALA